MTTSDWIAISGIATTFFVTLIGSVWHLSSSIGNLGSRITSLDVRVTSLEKNMDKLTDIVTQMRIEITEMKVRLDILWRHHMAKSNSPISLNNFGLEILTKSNIGAFADQYYHEVVAKVRSFKPENAYQAQELLISVMDLYKRNDECRLGLQEISFTSGYDIESLLLVAALSIRDRVIDELGFKVTEPKS